MAWPTKKQKEAEAKVAELTARIAELEGPHDALTRGLTARGEQLRAAIVSAVAGLRAIPYGASPAATQLHVTKVVNALERVLKGGA